MATPTDPGSDNKLKKRSKQQWHKLIGKVNEPEPPKAPPKDSHQQPHSQATQHKAIVPVQHQSVLSKQETSKENPDINELQREYQREIQRNMSSDEKNEGNNPLPLPACDARSGTLDSSRPVVDFPSFPNPTQTTSEHGSIPTVPGPVLHSFSAMRSMTHGTIVKEPDFIVNTIPERRPRRSSVSHPTQGIMYDSGVPLDMQQRQTTNQNRQNVKSYQTIVSELEEAQLEKQTLQRKLSEKATLVHERALALESMERSRNDMQAQRDSAQQAYERNGAQITNLQNEISVIQTDLLDWQRQFDIVNNELLQIRSDLNKHVNDKWFQSQWRDLHLKIEGVANQYFIGRQSIFSGTILGRGKGTRLDKMEVHPSISLTRLTNEHAQYLGSEHDRPLIIQAFIWWVLVNRVFAHTACDEWGFFWAGQSRELLYHLKRQILPPRPRDWYRPDTGASQRFEQDARHYHNWRATTAMLLLSRTPVDKRMKTIRDLINDIVGDIWDAVSPYIVIAKGNSLEAAKEGFRKQLEAILGEAIKLDAEMAQQRAWVYCEQWRAPREGDPLWGFACNPEEADIVQTADQMKGRRVQAQGSCIELVIQPALFRDGNQYGEEYVRQQVLCRAKVVLGETALPSFQHR